jgi:hypothetical protein
MRGVLGGAIAASLRRPVGFQTITFVGAGAQSSVVSGGGNAAVAYPSGLAAGDLLWVSAVNSAVTLIASNAMAAAGFTRRFTGTAGGSSPSIAGFYKIATGSESGTATLINPGSGGLNSMMLAFRGVDQTTPFDVADGTYGSASAATNYVISDQTPTMAGTAAIIMASGNAATGTWTVPGTYTPDLNAGGGTGVFSMSIAHRLGLAAGATGTRTIVRSTGLRGAGEGILLRPAAA